MQQHMHLGHVVRRVDICESAVSLLDMQLWPIPGQRRIGFGIGAADVSTY
jgi:hypothetical protein